MKIAKVLACVAILCLLLPTVSAIGISPGRITIVYKPEFKADYKGEIINNDAKNLIASLAIEGAHKEIITLHQTEIRMNPDESRKPFTFTVELPEELNESGIIAKIVATESIDTPSMSGTNAVVVGAVKMQIEVTGASISGVTKPIDSEELKSIKKGAEESDGKSLNITIFIILALVLVGMLAALVIKKKYGGRETYY